MVVRSLVVVDSVIFVVVEVSVGGSHRPLLGDTRSAMRAKIVFLFNNTTKDISNFFYFIFLFCHVFACFDNKLIRKTMRW